MRTTARLCASVSAGGRELARWRYDYNHVRPHSALGNLPPAQARQALELVEGSAPGALAPQHPDGYYEITRRLSS